MKFYLLATLAVSTEAVKLSHKVEHTVEHKNKILSEEEGWDKLFEWGKNAADWLGDQVEDATAAYNDIMEDVNSGDIMGAIQSAKDVAAEAISRGTDAWDYTNETLLDNEAV